MYVAPPGPCQLIKESGTLRLDDADGNVCESETVVITSCKGSCASWDKSTVMFVDKPDDIQHPKDCQCCQGFGDWVLHNVTCAEKVRSVKILQFDECRCSECESSPPPTDPNGGNESPDGPTSGLLPALFYNLVFSMLLNVIVTALGDLRRPIVLKRDS